MKTTLLAIATIFCLNLIAQEMPYEFSVLSEPYNELTDDISLTGGEIWDDPDLEIPLGFEFHYFGNVSTVLYIEYDISYGALVSTSILKDYTTKLLFPFEADIIDAGELSGMSESDISYKVEGDSPNRICKIQWNNCAFYNEIYDFGTAEDRVNFQLWLYEGTNDIEFRYGSMSVENDGNIETDGALVGLVGGISLITEELDDCFLLTEDPLDPEISTYDNIDAIVNDSLLSDVPTEGTVYRFASTVVSIDEQELVEKPSSKVYPTVFSDHITIETEGSSDYKLQNIAGQIVDQGHLDGNKNQLKTEQLIAGLYFLRVEDQNGIKTHRLVKK